MIDHLKNTEPGAFKTRELCSAFNVSRSGYYAHQRKSLRPRHIADQALAVTLSECFKASRHTYGTPRLREDLRDLGHRVGRRRIARLMQTQGLRPKQKRRFIPRTTDSSHPNPIAPNRLLHQKNPTAPGQIWVADITYIPTVEGWLYLAAEMDLCSRRIVGWEACKTMERSLVIGAFGNAISNSKGSVKNLIHHSDQGSQYASHDFTRMLGNFGIQRSMSRRGNCYDNAAMESFWSTLKAECFDQELPATRAQARSMIFDYIETFYNPIRRHSSLGYRSPLQYEHQTETQTTLKA